MADFFHELFNNEPLITAIIAWGIAALLKLLIEAIKSKQWDWERLLGPGGMPSTHTTPVVAGAASVGLVEGFDSSWFAIATILTFVVAYDAAGIRRHSGEQAKAITKLVEDLTKIGSYKDQSMADVWKRWDINELETLIAVGIVLGICTALIIHLKFAHIFPIIS